MLGPAHSGGGPKRASRIGSEEAEGFSNLEAEVLLAKVFGYATTLPSASQGRTDFTMEFARTTQAPNNATREIITKLWNEMMNW